MRKVYFSLTAHPRNVSFVLEKKILSSYANFTFEANSTKKKVEESQLLEIQNMQKSNENGRSQCFLLSDLFARES